MKEDLPKVFANKIEKKIDNSQDIFYQNDLIERKDSRSINKKIADIFNSVNFIYKRNVKIISNGRIFEKTIVGRKNNFLLTMDNEAINIDEITDIEEI